MKQLKCILTVCSVIILISVAILWPDFPKAGIKIKNFTLDANEQFVSMTVQKNNGQVGVLVFDMDANEWLHIFKDKKLTAMGKFSRVDPNILYVSSYGHLPDHFEGTDLQKCNLQSRECRYVFSMDGSLSNPMDFPDKSMLFVSSPIVWKGPEDKRIMRFSSKGFYLRSADGRVESLANLGFYELYSVSLTNGAVVFAADGPHSLQDGKLIVRRDYEDRSYIFKSKLDRQKKVIEVEKSIGNPLVSFGDFSDAFPSTKPGVSIVVFRSVNRGNPKKHRIVSYDEREKKIIDVMDLNEGGELSNPILINKSVIIYMIIKENKLQLFERNILSKKNPKIGEISLSNFEFMSANSVLY